MSADDSAVEKLDQMRRPALLGKQLEENLKDSRAAEPPEALPDRVPFAKLCWKGAPGDVVQREVVDRLQELAIIVPGFATAGLCHVEHRKRKRPILFGHLRQHGRPPIAGHAVIQRNTDSGIPQIVISGIPSTQPRLGKKFLKNATGRT
jgi:hypothetical protein